MLNKKTAGKDRQLKGGLKAAQGKGVGRGMSLSISNRPNEDKKGWTPDDWRIRSGIMALFELSAAGYDLTRFVDRRLDAICWKLYVFDEVAHWTYIKVVQETMRRFRLKNKAAAQHQPQAHDGTLLPHPARPDWLRRQV